MPSRWLWKERYKKILQINSISQIKWTELCSGKTIEEINALNEVRWGIEKIVVLKKEPVELLYRFADLRKVQHSLVQFYNFQARSFGEEPYRRLRIYPS